MTHTKRSWLLVGVLVGCIAGGAAAGAQSEGPLRHRPTAPIGRPEIVIYLANESGAGTRRDAEESKLETQITTAAMSEEAELIGILPRMPGHNGGAIFTNALSRGGSFLAWDGDGPDRGWHRVGWSPTGGDDPLLKAQNLALALSAVAARFPPERYNYVLIVKSLATDTLALAGPRADDDDGDSGVTRDALFALLSEGGKRNMHFGLVYLDTLSAVPLHAGQAVPENVTFFYGPGDFAPAAERLSYRRVLAPTSNADEFRRRHPSLALVHRLEAIRLDHARAVRAEQFASRLRLPWWSGGAALLVLVTIAAAYWIAPSAKPRFGGKPSAPFRRSGDRRLVD